MKYVFALLLFLTACSGSTDFNGNYFPGNFRSELNIGENSTIINNQSTLVAGQQGTSLVTTFDTKGSRIQKGGASISLSSLGVGTAAINETIDNQDGTYLVSYTAQKAGALNFRLVANSKTLSTQSAAITVTPGEVNRDSTDIYVTQKTYLIDQSGIAYVTLKDAFGNSINNGSYNLTASFVDGTSQFSFSSFTYQNGTYQSNILALEEGTVGTLSVFIRGVGVATSPYKLIVTPVPDDYYYSTIGSVASLKVGRATTLTITLRKSNVAVNDPLVPMVFTVSGVTGTFTRPVYQGSTYQTQFTPTSAGTATISAIVDGIEIEEGITVGVQP